MRTINDVKKLNKANGYNWFEPETMRFFASKVESGLIRGTWFVSSEKAGFRDNSRVYTIRRANDNGSVSKALDDKFDTLQEALDTIADFK